MKKISFILILSVFISICLMFLFLDTGTFGATDYQQYWGASKLLINGGNPYDSLALKEIQEEIGLGFSETIRMWNPPFIFPFIIPLALLTFKTSSTLWMFTMVILFIISIKSLMSRLCPPDTHNLWLLLWILTLYPLALSIAFGQISPVVLFGLSFYLICKQRSEKHQFLSGIALSLTLIKPHLLFLIYLELFTGKNKYKRQIILGFLTGGLALIIPSIIINREIITYYLLAIQSPPIYFKNPTIGSWLLEITEIHTIYIRILPTLLTAIGYFVLRSKLPNAEQRDYILIPLSLLTSPYTWVFDFIIVAPTIVWLTAQSFNTEVSKKIKRYLFSLLIIGNISLFIGGEAGQEYYVYYQLLIFLSVLVYLYRPLHEKIAAKL